MPEIRRPLTDKEAAQIRAALPSNLQPLIDKVYTVAHACWTCEHLIDGDCNLHGRPVPLDKRKGSYDCWSYDQEPF